MNISILHTNRGDTHHDLDPVIDAVTYQECENGCILNIMGIKVGLHFTFIEMSEEKPYVEIKREGAQIFVDAVFYNGIEKEIDLKKLESLVSEEPH